MYLTAIRETLHTNIWNVWATLEPLVEGDEPWRLTESFIVGSGSSKELAIIAACDVMTDAVSRLRESL